MGYSGMILFRVTLLVASSSSHTAFLAGLRDSIRGITPSATVRLLPLGLQPEPILYGKGRETAPQRGDSAAFIESTLVTAMMLAKTRGSPCPSIRVRTEEQFTWQETPRYERTPATLPSTVAMHASNVSIY